MSGEEQKEPTGQKRAIRFEVILDEETHKRLTAQAKKSKKTRAQFVRDLIDKRYSNERLKQIERIYLLNTRIVLDISRVTGNINQIAHQLNKQEIKFDEMHFYELAEELLQKVKEVMAELKANNKRIERVL